jgi:putative radical SAM enzyme (TIGR03279 family)
LQENAPGAVIERVEDGSIAAEAGLAPGDEIITINGSPVNDLIDYRYLCADDYIEVEVRKANGEEWLIEIDKEYDEELGVGFTSETFDGLRRCQNRCTFCFLDQMPVGMRHTLYVRDDDYRLSFLHGNFVTLTNLRPGELERIIAMHISPIYVSVHATDPEVRRQLIRNKRAGELMSLLRQLAEAEIVINCQVVLCPGVNDGEILDKTITDLAELWPHANSLAIVPVGLTRYRQGLADVAGVTAADAARVTRQVEAWQAKLAERGVTDFLYLADEFYLAAGIPMPAYEEYGNFPQLENGVGLIRLFEEEFKVAEAKFPTDVPQRHVAVVTGVSAAPFIRSLAARLSRMPGLAVDVLAVENRFFGQTVTVTGLLTGQDIRDAVRDLPPVDEVLIPAVSLRFEGDRFLDDITPDQLAADTGRKIRVVPVNGEAFAAAALGVTLS